MAPVDLVSPEALAQALRARDTSKTAPAPRQSTAKAAAPPNRLTREDTMPAAERTRLRQQRWIKDQKRHTIIPPRRQSYTGQQPPLPRPGQTQPRAQAQGQGQAQAQAQAQASNPIRLFSVRPDSDASQPLTREPPF